MDKLSMKALEFTAQMSGNTKTANQTADVSGDFRKLLEGKSEGSGGNQDNKEISKDTKPENVEASDDVKKDTASEEAGKTEDADKSGEADKTEGDTSQAEQMLAAQLQQRFTYGFVQNTPEAGAEVVVDTEGMTAEMTGTELEGLVQPDTPVEQPAVQMPETGAVQPVQTDMAAKQTDADVQSAMEVIASETTPVTAAEDTSKAGQQTQDFSSQLKNTAKSSRADEQDQTQMENVAAQQAGAGENKIVRTEDVRPKETVTVHVSQPEELPEKVTDQLLAKLTEGVQEFEIHIEPANLGKIAVKVLYAGSEATISIICSEKRAMEALGQNAKEIGDIINRNLGGETTIIVEKQETDYLNQTRDENEQSGQNQQKQKEENSKDQNKEDAEQFLQKLRLGLM